MGVYKEKQKIKVLGLLAIGIFFFYLIPIMNIKTFMMYFWVSYFHLFLSSGGMGGMLVCGGEGGGGELKIYKLLS